MDTRTKVYYSSVLIAEVLFPAGFLLSFWTQRPELPLMIIFLAPCVFLNSKAFLAITAKPPLRLLLRIIAIMDTLVLDFAFATMGFLLINDNLRGLDWILPVFVLAVLVGLAYSPSSYFRILREIFKAVRMGPDDSPAHRPS